MKQLAKKEKQSSHQETPILILNWAEPWKNHVVPTNIGTDFRAGDCIWPHIYWSQEVFTVPGVLAPMEYQLLGYQPLHPE